MKTLIIVDAQNDFMPGGALEVREGDRIVPVINKIIPKFELVLATQDWHPAEHKSFAINHPNRKEYEIIDLNGIEQKLWPPHCIQGTPGADFHPDLQLNSVEAIFRSAMDVEVDSYSGFYDNAHLKSTGLAGFLREKGADDLYFCGLAADICVYYTIKDALAEGFKATLIEDATVPLIQEDYEKVRKDILARGGKIITSEEL
ncbi:nicotinamidase/pyrazinamidase [Salinimicrobium catena]|uniref:nicotinamidase n=1 Tax=Salinimicrobium catena TaxID=390640 RepID=A0A1H5M911_9FLAO|nr:bifunctional nicotinamidase/pyrazinamidase [Salinimicrobium catena]SDL20193.1 nicotinamidase/pyrazinamidase [Salinimicrobium catena]SEE85734.1 nicotinamidase/pyrazinamidase [Salinimicrobium catena]